MKPISTIFMLLSLVACATRSWPEPESDLAPTPPPGPIVYLDQKTHFPRAGGMSIVPAGSYAVVRVDEKTLELINVDDKQRYAAHSVHLAHERELEGAAAIAIRTEEDVQAVALLLPEREGMLARGTISGIRPRSLGTGGVVTLASLVSFEPWYTPGDSWISIPGCAFVAKQDHYYNQNEVGCLWSRNTTGLTFQLSAYAPVVLPHGSKIRAMTIYWYDTDAYANLSVSLCRKTMQGELTVMAHCVSKGYYANWLIQQGAEVAEAAVHGSTTDMTVGGNPTIDRYSTYYLYAQIPAFYEDRFSYPREGWGLRLKSVVVEYTKP